MQTQGRAAGQDIGPRRADLQQQGLILQNALTGEETSSRLAVVERLGPSDVYDLITVAVRANQTASALSMLAASQRDLPGVFGTK